MFYRFDSSKWLKPGLRFAKALTASSWHTGRIQISSSKEVISAADPSSTATHIHETTVLASGATLHFQELAVGLLLLVTIWENVFNFRRLSNIP